MSQMVLHGIALSERPVDGSRSRDGTGYAVMLARAAPLAVPIPLLHEHKGDPIGKIIHLRCLGTQLYCRGIIFDTELGRSLWEKITDYKLRGLSCAFVREHYQITLREQEGVTKVFDRFKISEISIVRAPLNPDCCLAIYSGSGGEASIAGQPSLSEIRRINNRAYEILARVNSRLAKEKKVRQIKSRPPPGLSPRERVAWLKKSSEEGDA